MTTQQKNALNLIIWLFIAAVILGQLQDKFCR
jgi:hypothetical protein